MYKQILAALVVAVSCAPALSADAPYQESLRPRFHFTPDRNWMNDPNGLVYFQGEYHLFFQHDPNSIRQTPTMSWGHAVSPDLVHWTQLPIALSPDEHGNVWSGSAVVDWTNSAGFQTGTEPAMVAMYTGAKNPFGQCIAYSNDRGRTWKHYEKNPVIPHIAAGNRDPHVFWYAPGKKWVVVLFKDVDSEFLLFSSPDLKNWTKLQEFHVPGCAECPDFFPMPVVGEPTKVKWVFTAANGHYLVGSFDGEKFSPEQPVRQVDFGHNYYAVQSYNDIPPADGRRIQIAWMAGGKYPGMPFNQQMSFPATLTLHAERDGYRIYRNPVREIELLRGPERRWFDQPIKADAPPLKGIEGGLFDLRAEIEPGDAKSVGFVINGQTIEYTPATKRLSALGEAEVELIEGRLVLRVLVDRTSIETFANGGRASFTSCYLPGAGEPGIRPFARGGEAKLVSLDVAELKSAWPAPKE